MKPEHVEKAAELVKAIDKLSMMIEDIKQQAFDPFEDKISMSLGEYDSDGSGVGRISFACSIDLFEKIIPQIKTSFIHEAKAIGVDIED